MTEAILADSGKPPRAAPRPALEWWGRLADPHRGSPGTLAQLRRSRSPAEAIRVREALDLARRMGGARTDSPDWHTRAALDLARVLAHVREHDPRQHPMRAAGWKRFPGSRREADAGEDRPRLSEARFRRLLLTGDGEEKVSAFIRLIRLLDGAVHVDDLARDFITWSHPEHGERVRERWAFLYYAAADAAPPPPPDPTTDDEDAE